MQHYNVRMYVTHQACFPGTKEQMVEAVAYAEAMLDDHKCFAEVESDGDNDVCYGLPVAEGDDY